MKFSLIVVLLSIFLVSQESLTLARPPSLEEEVSAKQTGNYVFSHHLYSDKPGSVHSMSFSPNGKYLAIGFDKGIEVWNFETRTEVWELRGSQVKFFLRDDELVTSSNGETKTWNLETRELMLKYDIQQPSSQDKLFDLAMKKSELNETAMSQDGQYQASLSSPTEVGRIITISSVADGKIINTIDVKNYKSIAFSPDGRSLVLSNMHGNVAVWTLAPFLNFELPLYSFFNGTVVDYKADGK